MITSHRSVHSEEVFMDKINRLFVLSVVVLLLTHTGCETTAPTRTQLLSISNLRAYSKSSTEVGLIWTASPDTEIADEHRITVTGGAAPLVVTVPINESRVVIGDLTEGIIYTFSVIIRTYTGSYADSWPVSIQWSPARRLTTIGTSPIDVFEILSDSGARSGLQFYDPRSAGPRVLPIDTTAGSHQIIDVLLDTTTTAPSGILILESAHLNPRLPGLAQARRTRFSTVESDADSLDVGQVTPPAAATYTRDVVTLDTGTVSSGKIFYAVSQDTNYVRIFVQRQGSSGTLFLGDRPNRRIRVHLSYQREPGVIFSRPSP